MCQIDKNSDEQGMSILRDSDKEMIINSGCYEKNGQNNV